MMTRQEKILSCIDPATQLGLEMGALSKPIVTREMGEVRYADHATTEELKEKYASDPNVDIEEIVDVDYVWGAQTLPELVEEEALFDYVIASHVIEHVPDLIGWLKEIHAVLKPGGILSLAIPDKRYCFDFHRPTTQLSDVIGAYLLRQRKPSPRQIFDFYHSIGHWQGQFAWSANPDFRAEEVTKYNSPKTAWQTTQQIVASNAYHDVHCWVFTPDSSVNLIKALIPIGLFDFRVAQFPQPEGFEFYISLVAMDLTKEEGIRHQIQLESLKICSDQLSDSSEQSEVPTFLQDQLRLLTTDLQQEKVNLVSTQNKLQNARIARKRLKRKIENLEGQLTTVKKEITALQNSKLWKLRNQWVKLKRFFRD